MDKVPESIDNTVKVRTQPLTELQRQELVDLLTDEAYADIDGNFLAKQLLGEDHREKVRRAVETAFDTGFLKCFDKMVKVVEL